MDSKDINYCKKIWQICNILAKLNSHQNTVTCNKLTNFNMPNIILEAICQIWSSPNQPTRWYQIGSSTTYVGIT